MIINFDIGTTISYILVLISAFIVGLFLRIPILPEKPIRNSWTISIIFPTLIIALGFFAIISNYNLGNNYTSVIIGIISPIFAKYGLEKLFPRPDQAEKKNTD